MRCFNQNDPDLIIERVRTFLWQCGLVHGLRAYELTDVKYWKGMIAETRAALLSGVAETHGIRAFAEPKNVQARVVFAIIPGLHTPG